MENETLAKKIGRNLKIMIRKSKYRTQDQFANVMNVDPVTVRRWIAHGIRDINTIFEIANALDVDIMDLIKFESKKGE